jgi:hypothetical protein
MKDLQIKEIKMFEVHGKSFYTREDALRYVAHSKEEQVLVHVRNRNVLGVLREMIKQGITNKNRMLNLIKKVELEQNDL